jgi:phytoene dehydrogenase-like protein
MEVDAVVVGSGPNGLVAANLLADAGWDVIVLEQQSVHRARDEHPDYVHDTFSSFHPLAMVSPVMSGLHLEEHGLTWSHAPAVVGTPYHDGPWAMLHRDRELTAKALEADAPGDGDAWLRLCDMWDRVGDEIVDTLMSPFPPLRRGARALGKLPGRGAGALLGAGVGSAAGFMRRQFRGDRAQMLVAGNAVHADAPLGSPGSGIYGLLLTMTAQKLGYPAPTGGAGALADALFRRLESRGGRVVCDTPVVRVVVEDGRAVGVRTSDGTTVRARRAVVADVTAPQLYGGLVPWHDLPARTRRLMRWFRWDPGTIKVDWALSGRVPWAVEPDAAPGTVHLSESLEEVLRFQRDIDEGAVPARPFLLGGLMATTDPSRAPAGKESMFAYTHVPQQVRSDAGDDGITGAWAHDDIERMADRMQARIEEYAPGFGDLVLARRVLGPRELEARDANLRNGALNGGTGALRQQLMLRPVPGLGRPTTPVHRLYLASMSAHPGGGVHGACGANAAHSALRAARK